MYELDNPSAEEIKASENKTFVEIKPRSGRHCDRYPSQTAMHLRNQLLALRQSHELVLGEVVLLLVPHTLSHMSHTPSFLGEGLGLANPGSDLGFWLRAGISESYESG